MKQDDRAKQFLPFSPLKGYDELIEESLPTEPPQTKPRFKSAPPKHLAAPKGEENRRNLKKPFQK